MKAAVLHKAGEIPHYEEFPDPIPGQDEQLVYVKAASIKNLDRMRAQGTHYDSYPDFPVVVGVDCVGVLEDGTRVYTGSQKGMMAEKAAVSKYWTMPIPDGLDDVTAAALPNPAVSAWLALEWKGRLQKGGAVLIMGATGITGRLAIQLAKHLGAGKVVAMGRNQAILNTLPGLGADDVISLNQPQEAIREALKAEAVKQPFDIVLDYLWGEPAELVLEVLTGHDLGAEGHPVRYIQIGEMAGPSIKLDAATLRSSAIEMCGQGGGGISKEVLKKIPTVYLPEIFRLSIEGKLRIDTETAPLEDVGMAWQRADGQGKRMVVTM
jgi:NADPH:quinone reductase-like Zn-dependent oxidoreductase